MANMLRRFIVDFEQTILRWTNLFTESKPVLCFVTVGADEKSTGNHSSVLDSIFGSTLWAVPKSRRSVERRWTRKMGEIGHFEHARPKKNLIACLECGHWHESHTICGNCYKKVREETKAMQKTFGDDLKYDHPLKEVVFLYDDEVLEDHTDKYVVKMDKSRPKWFHKSLLTRAK